WTVGVQVDQLAEARVAGPRARGGGHHPRVDLAGLEPGEDRRGLAELAPREVLVRRQPPGLERHPTGRVRRRADARDGDGLAAQLLWLLDARLAEHREDEPICRAEQQHDVRALRTGLDGGYRVERAEVDLAGHHRLEGLGGAGDAHQLDVEALLA